MTRATGARRPILVINLKQETKRLAFMQEQLDRMNLSFEVIEAIDGKLLSREQFEEAHDPQRTRQKHVHTLRPVTVACALSHLKALEVMVERQVPEAVILEDDTFLDQDFPAVLDGIELPEECQLLQLSASHGKIYPDCRRCFSPYQNISLPRGYKMSPYIDVIYGALAYVIRLDYAQRLLREGHPVTVDHDLLLYHWKYNFYIPWIVYKEQADGGATTLARQAPEFWTVFESVTRKKKFRHQDEVLTRLKQGVKNKSLDTKQGKTFPVFLINLKRDQERLSRVKKKFAEMNLRFETVEAVNGEQLAEEQLKKIYDPGLAVKKYGRTLSPAEIGRYLSHLQAYRAMLEKNVSQAIILEDTVKPGEDFAAMVKGHKQPGECRSADMFFPRVDGRPRKFFSPYGMIPLPDGCVSAITDKDISTVELILRSYTRAYLVQRTGAQKLLRRKHSMQTPIDQLLFRWRPPRERQALTAAAKIGLKTMGKNIFLTLRVFFLRYIPLWNPGPKRSLLQFKGEPNVFQYVRIVLSFYAFSKPFTRHRRHRGHAHPPDA